MIDNKVVVVGDKGLILSGEFNKKLKKQKTDVVSKLIKRAGIKRVKIGNRYDKAVIYMFRKRFNGKLKGLTPAIGPIGNRLVRPDLPRADSEISNVNTSPSSRSAS